MKAVDFPAVAPVPASPCEGGPAPLSDETQTGAFAQLMEQAMGDATADTQSSPDSETDAPVETAPDLKAIEPDPATASHWLAALIVPLVTPTATKAPAAAAASETDVMATGGEASPVSRSTTEEGAIELPTNVPTQTPTPRPGNEVSSAADIAPKISTRPETQRAAEAVAVTRSVDVLKPLNGGEAKAIPAPIVPGAPSAPAVPATPVASAAASMPPSTFNSNAPNTPAAAIQIPAPATEDSAAESAATTEVAGQKLPEGVSVEPAPRPNRPPRDEIAPKARPSEDFVAPESRGTSGAKHVSPTNSAENMNDFTGSSEQNLPGTATLDAPPNPVKPSRNDFSTPALKTESVGETSLEFTATPHRAEAVTGTTATASPVAARTLERTEDLMALHGLRLRDSGLDSMRVVIKPDPNLHLALNVQMRDNAVEITAQIQRGDRDLISRHWPELQAQLEQRGIRVAPLSPSDSNANSSPSHQSNHSFSQHSSRQQHDERQPRSGAFAEFALESVLVPKRTAKPATPRGWESWA